jgi:hypothetical protein
MKTISTIDRARIAQILEREEDGYRARSKTARDQ